MFLSTPWGTRTPGLVNTGLGALLRKVLSCVCFLCGGWYFVDDSWLILLLCCGWSQCGYYLNTHPAYASFSPCSFPPTLPPHTHSLSVSIYTSLDCLTAFFLSLSLCLFLSSVSTPTEESSFLQSHFTRCTQQYTYTHIHINTDSTGKWGRWRKSRKKRLQQSSEQLERGCPSAGS